jgi:hypothetical protein
LLVLLLKDAAVSRLFSLFLHTKDTTASLPETSLGKNRGSVIEWTEKRETMENFGRALRQRSLSFVFL